MRVCAAEYLEKYKRSNWKKERPIKEVRFTVFNNWEQSIFKYLEELLPEMVLIKLSELS